ncbi:MAG: hypothetical protein HGA23_06745, partial [Bacteroidales bacterium]|nr:hypothetical protein [Bacteroidales bacterium]
PTAVSQLVKKARQGGGVGETDEMALVGIISTQLVHHHFVDRFKMLPPLSQGDPVKVRVGKETALAQAGIGS